jgi:Domain of unknown function (DUF4342)
MSQRATTVTEKFDVKGDHLVQKVKELVHEGNVRRIVINFGVGAQLGLLHHDVPTTV